ncbi:alpha-amylase family protein [Granulicella aggregans]|uniref:alpha-amylase family glycosyl hydrolase n=1 Tax=Granulicella aggregans TaxID=474949 RepID=UPI0021E0053A|nr:alpha-amylase family glycosyl hydrolase [Granulicella aggregans]
MEFHVSRAVRLKTGVEDVLFNFAGNVVFGNLAACREFAKKFNEARTASGEDGPVLHAAALFAMGLIDELNHAMVAKYRESLDPELLSQALRWLESIKDAPHVRKLLLEFSDEFPSVSVYRGEQTSSQWLAGTTPAAVAGTASDFPNREAAVEELLMLWLANRNPAFMPFKELFDDSQLEQKTIYKEATASLPEYFATRPKMNGRETLFEALIAPVLASPDSLSGQLAYMRDNWAEQLGPEFSETLRRTLIAVSVLKEEEIAIWTMFHPVRGGQYRDSDGKWVQEGFLGDEFVGFGDGATIGADGARSGPKELPPPLNEYEAFSPDQAWMPTVVMIAKSTYVWLEQLSKKYQRHIHRLDQIPGEELGVLAERGINALWLIGLWERSTASQTIKRLMGQHDAVASAYSLKDYRIAEDLGGTYAYERLRDLAGRYGIRLASDMVPNHMGIDSTWVMEHPEWFLSRHDSPFPVYSFEGPDLSAEARFEIKIEDHYFDQSDAAVVFRLRERSNGDTRFVYHGNDGTTFAWNDTAQLDYSKAYVREHVIQTILQVARLFPIIRFDAAMTLAKKHVQRLWFPLPEIGGSIPSRAESAISQAEFDAMMPNEFWREVVDRVAVEVPGTLLLAEAFWLLEGYFVRTLGMHRVYNSAFMNMLRDEENAKYRSYLKKTIEFDPDILKRYVNFMSNPDEKTAIAQFGTGDKYFGTCTMLATIPGLPMIGHGQIEAFTEKYGMEYKQARFDEWPNDDLVARHMREIAPLLKNRQLFAESHNFVMYDFWAGPGDVNENVFAYSNMVEHGGTGYGGSGKERALILYNNSFSSTHGTVHLSVSDMDKYTGNLRQRTLSQALHLASEGDLYFGWHDTANRLEYICRSTDFDQSGFTIGLRGYQYAVLIDWRELRSTEDQPWEQLCSVLGGTGVYSLDVALAELRLRPLHQALRHALEPEVIAAFLEPIAAEDVVAEEAVVTLPVEAAEDETDDLIEEIVAEADALAVYGNAFAEESSLVGAERISLAAEVAAEAEAMPVALPHAEVVDAECEARFAEFCARADSFFEQANLAEPTAIDAKVSSSGEFAELVNACGQLTQVEAEFTTPWPESAKRVLPSAIAVPGTWSPTQRFAPVLAWLLIDRLVGTAIDSVNAVELFDMLHLRSALAEIFSSLGIDRESAWRVAARVRILLANPEVTTSAKLAQEKLWADGDLRWLACLTESGGVTYVNKECFEELAWWLQVPELIVAAGLEGSARAEAIKDVEEFIAAVNAAAAEAGYDLTKILAILSGVKIEEADVEKEPIAVEPEVDVVTEPEPVAKG